MTVQSGREKSRRKRFDGETYDETRDGDRLYSQLIKVKNFLVKRYPLWVGLKQIATAIHAPDSSIPAISARLRDLRKPHYGGYTIERRYVHRGLFEYRLLLKEPSDV